MIASWNRLFLLTQTRTAAARGYTEQTAVAVMPWLDAVAERRHDRDAGDELAHHMPQRLAEPATPASIPMVTST